MLRFGVKLDSSRSEVKRRIDGNVRDNLLRAVMEWHNSLVGDVLVGMRRGRKYPVPGTGRTYTASAPGEPPAVRLGHLRNSYRFRVVGVPGREVGEVGSPLDYALELERGGRGVAPRPHVRPAYEKRKRAILDALSRRWDR